MKKSSIITASAAFAFCLVSGVFAGTDDASQKAILKKNLQLAENGDAVGQFQMGMAYDSGTGVEKDVPKALDWYRKPLPKVMASR